MATGLNSTIKSIVAIVIITMFMFIFAFQFVNETNPSVLTNSSLQNYSTRLNSDIQNLTGTVDNARVQLQDSKLSVSYLFIMFENAFWIPMSYLAFLIRATISLPSVIFPALSGTGLGDAIGIGLTVMFTIITATIIFLIIKAIRTGESER